MSSTFPPLPHAVDNDQLNNALQERKLDSQYVTMLYAVWNDEDRCLQVSNSGAVQPINQTSSKTRSYLARINADGQLGEGLAVL